MPFRLVATVSHMRAAVEMMLVGTGENEKAWRRA